MSIKSYYQRLKPIYNIPWSRRSQLLDRKIERCPYCRSRGLVRRGRRQTKTGHIDILQIRNGLIHILDFKPNARKEKPYTQLTLYAMALSRLTSLRLMDFKCAWFDENDYFEFFPLHIVYKLPCKH